MYLHVHLIKAVNCGSVLLHTPALASAVLSFRNILRDRPDGAALSHVESAHGLLVCRKLVGVKNSTTSHESGVTILLEPLCALCGTLGPSDAHLGSPGLFDGLHLLVLTRLVVGSGGETDGFPNRRNARRAEVGLSNEREIDIEPGESEEGFLLGGLLRCLVQSVSKSFLGESILQADLGDGLIAVPEILKSKAGALKEAEVCANIRVLESQL